MIYAVGIGPGERAQRTAAAEAALQGADVLVGYHTYIDIVMPDYPGKPAFATAMMGEVERCREALRLSRQGQNVAVVCSGDAAVYGMAGLLMELADVDDCIEVVPGITAAMSASAVLGAPLAGDMAIISLSDLLTPWDVIERRLDAAARGDFCMAIYNPSSKKRADHLCRAVDIVLRWQSPELPCGWVRNIGRAGQCSKLLTLGELRQEQVDMFTTVIIGNSATIVKDGRMITPRGYRK